MKTLVEIYLQGKNVFSDYFIHIPRVGDKICLEYSDVTHEVIEVMWKISEGLHQVAEIHVR
jgi:hypothetical protein